LVPWTFTAGAVSVATGSLIANSSLITKIKLPREIFPITSILVKVVDFALSFVVLFILMIAFQYPFHVTMLLIPVIFLIQFILIMGVSFILSALNVFYRDVENLLEVILLVWMYLTPVFYPPEFIPQKFQMLFNLNPMMGIINAYRNVILWGVLPPAQSFMYATVLSIGIFIAGYTFFLKKSKYFADVL
jgi:ABC-2 type transport system permease protein